ncbi:MAG: YceI family protein, partial [Kiritimatiellae bacterium]|nr:YceI family protein [Kiritimatiellia bacterium]
LYTLLFLSFGMLAQPLPGENFQFGLNDHVEVTLKGSSNINHWECNGEKLNLQTELVLNGKDFQETLQLAWEGKLPLPLHVREHSEDENAPFVLQVPVESLNCARQRMQQDLREAVKFNKHPFIRYELVEIRKITPVSGEKETVSIELTGNLYVAGVVREIEHEIEVVKLDKETFRIRGRLDLKMTRFDMEPPTALLGLIKARDLFEVGFQFQAKTESIDKEVSKDLVYLVTESK